jgi:hypothetical protein
MLMSSDNVQLRPQNTTPERFLLSSVFHIWTISMIVQALRERHRSADFSTCLQEPWPYAGFFHQWGSKAYMPKRVPNTQNLINKCHSKNRKRSALQFQIRCFRFTFRFKYENRSGVWRTKCRITQFLSTHAINLLMNFILLQNITHSTNVF